VSGGGGRRLVVGIFVGGGSRRMGGYPKGLLLAPREGAEGRVATEPRVTILDRTVALGRSFGAEVLLVGRASAYGSLGLATIDDAFTTNGVPAEGPLAGLVGLLEHARDATVIALACDMPYLTGAMLSQLTETAPDAVALAPREPGDPPVWSPLFARYDAPLVAKIARTKLDAGERSLRVVLESIDTRELPLSPEERRALRDWDAPSDIDDPEERKRRSALP
jgi:molybdopterin-guanine dinucleotide biosynthesis protein A